MTDDIRLPFDEPKRPYMPEVRARTTHPDTSHVAAKEITAKQEHRRDSMRLVVGIIRDHAYVGEVVVDGKRKQQLFAALTDIEIGERFFKVRPGSDALPRMARLWARKMGLVRKTGEKRENLKTNQKAILWGLGRDEAFLADEAADPEFCESCGQVLK